MTKLALITGAARRIGRAIALDMAQHGWDIIIHFHRGEVDAQSLAQEIGATGQNTYLAQIDFTKLDHVQKLIPALVAELGPLSALINNAALFEPDNDNNQELHHLVNYESARILSENFYWQLPNDAAGTIVNLLDTNPHLPQFVAYSESKQRLAQLTRQMAAHYAPRLRVNGIALGPVLAGERQSPQHFNEMVMATPLQSQIQLSEIATAVRFLIDSPSITGEMLHVDSGQHLQVQKKTS